MEPYSYFLPPCYRYHGNHSNHHSNNHRKKNNNKNYDKPNDDQNRHGNCYHGNSKNTKNSDENVQTLNSVYSHRLEENNNCQKKFTDNGRSMTFGKRTDSTFTFSTYHMPTTSSGVVQKQCRVFTTLNDCDYSLYCCVDEICFMFTLRDGGSRKDSVCSIHVSCMCFDGEGGAEFYEDVAVLEYQHKFNQYSCSQSNNEHKIVVVTGRDLDAYGTDQEIVDNYVDVLSYEKFTDNGARCTENQQLTEILDRTNSCTNCHSPPKSLKRDKIKWKSTIKITHERRKNVTKSCKLFDIDRIFFSLCGTKLFLIFGKSFLVFSMNQDIFGPVLDLPQDDRYHMSRYCFYLHNSKVGNVLLMCQSDGLIYTIREKNLSLELIYERTIELDSYGFASEHLFTFLHVDHYNEVLIYFTVEKELFVLNYLTRCIVGRFVSKQSHYIVDVKTNWSGEEVFVFCDLKGCRSPCGQLEIIFNGNSSSLKELAKIKVLQTFSKHQLKNMDIPTILKLEMNIF